MASSASVGAGAGVSIRPKAEVVLIGLKSAGMNGQWGVTGAALNAKGRWYVTSVTTCVLRAACCALRTPNQPHPNAIYQPYQDTFSLRTTRV